MPLLSAFPIAAFRPRCVVSLPVGQGWPGETVPWRFEMLMGACAQPTHRCSLNRGSLLAGPSRNEGFRQYLPRESSDRQDKMPSE